MLPFLSSMSGAFFLAMSHKYEQAISPADVDTRILELLFFEDAALEKGTRSNQQSVENCYTFFCKGAGLAPFPISFITLGLFLIQYSYRFGHTTRSIPGLLSHLKRIAREHGCGWLSDIDKARLDDVITGLKKFDRSVPARKLPMTHDVLGAIQRVASMQERHHYQHITMARVAKDALLRGGELVKLRRSDLTWTPDLSRVTLRVIYSKANKLQGPPEFVTIADYGPTSGVAFLREYCRFMGFNYPATQPMHPLWPQVSPQGKVVDHKFTTKDAFVAIARSLLTKAGFKATSYSGHSYRSGGATDLWNSQRCRPLTIKLHGRWKSDAYRLYIRDNRNQAAEEVAQAMAFFCNASQP